ncbi:MAG TPA: caleosin family protein [Polyangiaceae bacterium]|nr:caleosin family protein [Polyangiaceae bacterium]
MASAWGLIAGLLTLLINSFLGYLTHGKPSLSVSVKDIACGKHPYDTGTFNELGERDDQAFAALFSAPTAEPPFDRLTRDEIRAMIVKRGDPRKPFGELGSLLSNWFSGREIQLLCASPATVKGRYRAARSRPRSVSGRCAASTPGIYCSCSRAATESPRRARFAR